MTTITLARAVFRYRPGERWYTVKRRYVFMLALVIGYQVLGQSDLHWHWPLH